MDDRTKQAIKDMRYDIAKLELKLNNTARNAHFSTPDGMIRNKREVIQEQLLELRQRLKAVLEIERIYDEMQG